ncbi:MAG TPA: cupin domain-containing protein [Rudaea sp.]|jgi:quercetin dioxygenase-like cupin family protein|uniref:cupin domain-containing protein n=1 Tax=Rudaea sp. TaxID=2136325 RepID=UPI002F923B15
MKRLGVLLTTVVAGGLLFVAGTRLASAQDPAVVNSKFVHVKLDNAHVRVLDSLLQPGDKEQLHSHSAYVTYVISGGKLRNHLADGKTTETEIKTGDVLYRDAVSHWSENIGTTPIEVLLVELKNPG